MIATGDKRPGRQAPVKAMIGTLSRSLLIWLAVLGLLAAPIAGDGAARGGGGSFVTIDGVKVAVCGHGDDGDGGAPAPLHSRLHCCDCPMCPTGGHDAPPAVATIAPTLSPPRVVGSVARFAFGDATIADRGFPPAQARAPPRPFTS